MKTLFILLSLLGSVFVATASDLTDYQLNPQKLAQALASCPQKHPTHVTCDELAQVGTLVNQLVISLQTNPQAYGFSILQLQTMLAEQIAQQRQQPSPQLKQQIAQNQRTLQERLGVIRWLESPKRSR